MAFKEAAKVKDFAQVGIVTNYKCDSCGWKTQDEAEFKKHKISCISSNSALEKLYPILAEYPSEHGNMKFVKSIECLFVSDRDIQYLMDGKPVIFNSNDGQEICLRKET